MTSFAVKNSSEGFISLSKGEIFKYVIQKQPKTEKEEVIVRKLHYLPTKSPTFFNQNSDGITTELVYVKSLNGALIYQGDFCVKLLPDFNPLEVSKIDQQIEFCPKLFFKGVKPSVLNSKVLKKSNCSNYVFIKNDFNQLTMLRIRNEEQDDYFYSHKAKLKIGISNIVDFEPFQNENILTLTNDCILRLHRIDYKSGKCELCFKYVLLSKFDRGLRQQRNSKCKVNFTTEYNSMNLEVFNFSKGRKKRELNTVNFEEYSILGCLEKNEEADLIYIDKSNQYAVISTIKYPSLTQNSLILVKFTKQGKEDFCAEILCRRKFENSDIRFKCVSIPHLYQKTPIVYALECSKPYTLHSFYFDIKKRKLVDFKEKIGKYHGSITHGFEVFRDDMWSIDWDGKLNKLSFFKQDGENETNF